MTIVIIMQYTQGAYSSELNRVNLFVSTPVAATGFQTMATYYTCRHDELRGTKRTLL